MIVRKSTSIISIAFLGLHMAVAAAFALDLDSDGVVNTDDVCPMQYNPMQGFSGDIGCRDDDGDGFEDMFWDICVGIYGSANGCPSGVSYDRYAQASAELDVTAEDTIPVCTQEPQADLIQAGDTLMIFIDSPNGEPILSSPEIVR